MGEREKETDWKKGGKKETEGRKRQTNVYKKTHRRKHQKEETNEKTKKKWMTKTDRIKNK